MTYLDATQKEVHTLVSDMQTAVYLDTRINLVSKLGAKFSKDGNKYCWLYGELPNDCVIGFGDTPDQALSNFYNNFLTCKP